MARIRRAYRCRDEPFAVSTEPSTRHDGVSGSGVLAATICAHIAYRPEGLRLAATTNASAKLDSGDPLYRRQALCRCI